MSGGHQGRNQAKRNVVKAASCLALAAALPAQQLSPQTEREFECFVQSAEARLAARPSFLLADSDSAMNDRLVRDQQIQTVPAGGANPRKISGGQIYDWIGTVFIPGSTLERTVQMLKDYDHRAQYFPDVLSSSKLLCRTGENHFHFVMRLKEPAVIDTENDVVWERVDQHRWRCHSYSTNVHEIGKDHGYLLRLYSYWRFSEGEKGVYVEGETVTLSREFSGFTRALGSMIGISPEKSLRRSLASMKESVLKPGLQFAPPPPGITECGSPFHPGGCEATGQK